MTFNSIKTRFSHERRVKLIFMCLAAFFVSLLPSAFTAYSEGTESTETAAVTEIVTGTEPAETRWGHLNLIRTSYSTDNYSIFETQRDKISARGVYTDDNIRKLFIDSEKSEFPGTYSMSSHKDGSYEAEISCQPEEGAHKLIVKLNSGALMKYQMYYDQTNGWYFPSNGYETDNRRAFDYIFEAPEEACALYISPTKDPEEISTALEQISMLAEQAVAGLDDDYEKARAISAYIASHVYYDFDAKESSADVSTIALCNVLKTGRTVCAGFANLFCAMAEAVGIDAVNIKGGAANDIDMSYSELIDGRQTHEWAAFFYEKDKRWVWADACWDGSGSYQKGEFKPGLPKYMYFDISDEAFALNHRADKAERRKYFSAKTETSIIGADSETDGDAQSVITSQQTEAPDENVPEDDITADTQETEDSAQTKEDPVSEDTDTVYIIIIAALSAAVIAVAVILIRIIIKGRKM